ncbi:phosphatidic acid phosphatase type 2/haloperoxidase [Umbelopsis sp. PMI_123]|nr:phosphatidic acid phosphatase type 2/haloperoxidase [Umbelopsis sp. PMI_123]
MPSISLKGRRKHLFVSYIKDWILVIILIVVFLVIDGVDPFYSEFPLQNRRLMYTLKNDTLSIGVLAVLAVVVPFLIIATVSIFLVRSPLDLHNGTLGLLVSVSFTIMITEIVKLTVGAHRPDFLAVCAPREGAVDPPLGLSDVSVCTRPIDYLLKDAFKSFPSGHTSIGFAGLVYLSLYFAGKLRIFVVKTGYFYRGFIVSMPILGAVLVGVSRITDYKHHTWDVVAGALLGTIFAYFAYRQYYPSLWSPHSGIPFEPRIPKTNDMATNDNISISQQLAADYGVREESPQLGNTTSQSFELGSSRFRSNDAAKEGDKAGIQ